MHGSVYVGSSLLNSARAVEIMNALRSEGVQITYDWTVHGQVFEAQELARIAVEERNGVRCCDVFLMVFPARTGSHVEFGMALGYGKHIVILDEGEHAEPKAFYYLPEVRRFNKADKAMRYILELLKGMKHVE